MSTIFQLGKNIGFNGITTYPVSGTPAELRAPGLEFNKLLFLRFETTLPLPAADFMADQDNLLFEDGSTLIYDEDSHTFLPHEDWVKTYSSAVSAREFFASFKQPESAGAT